MPSAWPIRNRSSAGRLLAPARLRPRTGSGAKPAPRSAGCERLPDGPAPARGLRDTTAATVAARPLRSRVGTPARPAAKIASAAASSVSRSRPGARGAAEPPATRASVPSSSGRMASTTLLAAAKYRSKWIAEVNSESPVVSNPSPPPRHSAGRRSTRSPPRSGRGSCCCTRTA
jgi:hypothetical protein